jgi:hypothetical protein
MKLKLNNGIIEIVAMKVPELINHTYLEYLFEKETSHLHPVLTFDGVQYTEYNTFITLPEVTTPTILVKVELFDDNNKIIHVYESNLKYNRYQITGVKPIRPDIEEYIFSLEEQIRNLISLYEARIKQLEEKGELI